MQIYKTAQSGWGVRALCDIPAGSFIANYVGALLTDSLADALHGEDEYFADLDLNDAVSFGPVVQIPSNSQSLAFLGGKREGHNAGEVWLP